ncbi:MULTISPECIES: ribosome maturation factor RimP [Carboxydocella]|uniref:Ribosome maturation factor RimP n=2 Tax=Carboxydocella TaxID=178898 RepID=A0A1T4P706_9FIRM|nr:MULTISPECIES: ribosome maturation factor RimP [Carboxydocella]AVX20724.1 ribosome maturation factor RimP [Carboxydocella thermautotrophica]AVX31143.1 ribosome maturation factor RimP [Carboxydocella thermautotrophica]SJZ87222.1 ribosome maturation factor RimP [Carboxydocella sporoproducens DSM 16521]GAW28253.1 ribosome maturation factor [Carboxydocella sp. ULO1]GAW30714.1 ribosome maturation factor [Carboxydocella sp. JDF658]
MNKKEVCQKVLTWAQEIAEPLGIEVVDVELEKEHGEWYLRIFIDKPEGINIDDCEMISRQIDPVLDNHDPIPFPYHLEVSSLGLDRPLKNDQDLARSLGKKVRISLFAPFEGKKEWIGTLRAFSKERVVIGIGEEMLETSIPRNQIAKIKLEIDF